MTTEPLFKLTPAAPAAPVVARPESPLSSAIRTAFRFLYVVVAVLALGWLGSGLRQVEPGSQAVILRFGAIDRVQGAGLVIAWPRPFEEVVLVPSRERQLSLEIGALDLLARDNDNAPAPLAGIDPRRDGGYVLTGDAGIAHLRGTVTYQVVDPRAWFLNRDRATAALRRAFCAAAIQACAGRGLDGVMVAGLTGDEAGSDERLAQSRERLRGDILAGINRRLAVLDLGIEAARTDLVAYLPEKAKPAFDAVAAAAAGAGRELAEARTAATKALQESESARAAILAQAQAKAQETVSTARVITDGIAALATLKDPAEKLRLAGRLHRDKLDLVMRALSAAGGSVIAVDGSQPVKVYVSGR
jgi:regulator of protease activity HflC (stomatin/prohibitin superfamily)